MCFPEVEGHAEARAFFAARLRSGRLAHAYLVTGPPGVGKFLLARAVARARLCPSGGGNCDCPRCRLVAAGTHPDLFVLDDPEAPRLSIEAVRELSRRAARKARLASGPVFLVRDAERLTEEAQNASLKTLEEPPPAALLLLTTARPEGLLPTIRSRCQWVRLGGLGRTETARVLARAGVAPARAEVLAALAQGAPGQALTWERGGYLAWRGPFLEVVAGGRPPAGTAARVGAWLREGGAGVRGRTEHLVGLWLTLARDLLAASVGGEELCHEDLAAAIRETAAGAGPRRWEALVTRLQDALAALAVNAPADLVVTDVLVAAAAQTVAGPRRSG